MNTIKELDLLNADMDTQYTYQMFLIPLVVMEVYATETTEDTEPALATVVIDNCTISSRFIHISNTRPSHITDASEWPNLEITEVVANIEIGGSVRTSFACHR